MLFEVITYIIKNVAAVVLIYFILKHIVGYTFKIKKIAFLICFFLIVIFTILPIVLIKDTITAYDVADYSSLIAFTAFPYCMFKSRKKSSFFWFGLITNSTIDFFSFLFDFAFKITSQSISNIVYTIFLLIIYISLKLIKTFKHFSIPDDFFEKIPSMIYVAILLADLSAFYAMSLTSDPQSTANISYVLIAISTPLIIICIIYTIFKYIKFSKLQAEAEHQLSQQVEYYERILDENKNIRKFRHDYENNMLLLGSMINNGNIDEAKAYITELNQNIENTKITYSTGNRIADAIISDKANLSKPYDTDIVFNGTIPCVGISNLDLCTILANALQNACSACENIKNAKIIVSSVENKTGFILTITNPVLQKVLIKNNRIKTTKNDKINHGIGFDNIRGAVEKYNGFLTLDCTDDTFTFKTGLLLKQEA